MFTDNTSEVEKNATLGALAVQIGVVELLKAIELTPDYISGDNIGKIACLYYKNQLTLKEAILKASEIKISNNNNNNIKRSSLFSVQNGQKSFKDMEFISNNVKFLESIASLYLHGHNPQLARLYPKVNYPVSTNTPMISPLLKWDHQKDWETYKFEGFHYEDRAFAEYNIRTDHEELEYLEGHVIDGNYLT